MYLLALFLIWFATHAGAGQAVSSANVLSLSAQQPALRPPRAGQGTTAAAPAADPPDGAVGGGPERHHLP